MKQEIKTYFSKSERCLYITYLLIGDIATISFGVRCPSPKWNYYLPIGVDYHADALQYDEQAHGKCDYRASGKCYCDGSSLMAQSLWKRFTKSGEEQVIWDKLTEFYKQRFGDT